MLLNESCEREFTYFRALSVCLVAEGLHLSLSAALKLKADSLPAVAKRVCLWDNGSAWKTYMMYRQQIPSEYLFVTRGGNRLTVPRFYQRIERWRRLHPFEEELRALSPNALRQLLERMRFSVLRPRYQAVLAVTLLVRYGLRPGEVASLRKADIDFAHGCIRLRQTKSQKPQTIPLFVQDVSAQALQWYVGHLDDEEPLFVTKTGRMWTRREVHEATVKLASEFGLRDVTPQRIRPTVARQLLKAGATLPEVSAALRHKHTSTTADNYLAPMESDRIEAFRKFNPFPSSRCSDAQAGL